MGGQWRRIGRAAWLLEHGPDAPAVAALEALPGVIESWRTSAGTAVSVDPGAFDPACLDDRLPTELLSDSGKVLTVPVDYSQGEDLDEAARLLGLTPDEVVTLHCSGEYLCSSVGFAPGFAYLGPVDSPLSSLGRRASPRPRVEKGTVAVAAGLTAVYPGGTPGGWWLLGRTPLTVCDWRDGYFGIGVGDKVRFRPVGRDEFDQMVGVRLCAG